MKNSAQEMGRPDRLKYGVSKTQERKIEFVPDI